jgi:predicted aspartyl protease
MGEIVVNANLENFLDRALCERGDLPEASVRARTIRALADTGAVMTMLPQDIVDALGLKVRRTVIVSYADERREERPVAGALLLRIGDREMIGECIVGPPTSEALIGQVVLEELDLLADCQRGVLSPRPESPIHPLLRLK